MNHEHGNLLRESDMVEAVSMNRMLTEKVKELSEITANWEIRVTAEALSDVNKGFGLKITAFKTNGSGFSKTYSEEDIQYFVEDPETLVSELVDEIFTHLLKDQIRNGVTPLLTRGLRNANMMIERSK
jgi:hypothetical protein